MVQQVTPETTIEVIYPESDGQPMADNTEQFAWIVKIKENFAKVSFLTNRKGRKERKGRERRERRNA
jgi:hypothetical protein